MPKLPIYYAQGNARILCLSLLRSLDLQIWRLLCPRDHNNKDDRTNHHFPLVHAHRVIIVLDIVQDLYYSAPFNKHAYSQ